MCHRNSKDGKDRILRDLKDKIEMCKFHLIGFGEKDNRWYERDNINKYNGWEFYRIEK